MWRRQLLQYFPGLELLPRGCYVVGGAVRDLILERPPLDVDVASAEPLEAAHAISSRVIRLGDESHLTAWRVVLPPERGGHVYDFAALEGGAIETDLARRDFTVNAMAVDLDRDTLIDPFGGREDARSRMVRMVAASNFDDDPLRVLKGVRMAVRYGMEIDPATLEAMRERAPRVPDVAEERVTYELSLILSSNRFRRAVSLLSKTSLAASLGLQVGEFHADDVSLAGALAILVADPRAYGRRWRWSEAVTRETLALGQLIERHDRLALFDAGERVARQLPPVLRALGREESLDFPDFAITPLLSGNEIASFAGIEPGPQLGRIKRALVEAQVSREVATRDEAVAFVAAKATAETRGVTEPE